MNASSFIAAALLLFGPLMPAAAQGVRSEPVGPAANSPAPMPGQIGEDGVKELVAVFREMCLNRFPDGSALEAAVAAAGMARMTDEDVQGYLRTDPGHGWFYRTPVAEYAITVEHPPVRACAVRRMTPSGAASARPFVAAASEWAIRERGQLAAMAPQRNRSAGGTEVTAVPFAFVDASGRPTQSLIAVLTDYQGQYRGRDAAATTGGPGIEIRLVRQILPESPAAR